MSSSAAALPFKSLALPCRAVPQPYVGFYDAVAPSAGLRTAPWVPADLSGETAAGGVAGGLAVRFTDAARSRPAAAIPMESPYCSCRLTCQLLARAELAALVGTMRCDEHGGEISVI